MNKKRAFSFYSDYWQWLKLLSDEELGQLLRAVFIYEESANEPEFLNERTQMAFYIIKEDIDRDREKYERVRLHNSEIARARWQKTKSGGSN